MRDDRGSRDLLLVALAVSSGAVDAITWIVLGKVFAAFMTGNLAFLGFAIGGQGGLLVGRTAAALAAFGVGAAVGSRLVRSATLDARGPSRVTVAVGVVMVVQAVFLVLWLVVGGRPASGTATALTMIMALAMGVQTYAVFSLGERAMFSTAATATLTVLAGDLANWSPAARRERLRLLGVLIAVVTGAVAGSLLVIHARDWAPALPLAITAAVFAAATALDKRPAVPARPQPDTARAPQNRSRPVGRAAGASR